MLSGFMFLFFFFFKQKTAYEMRISDWSSDVCSSDLPSALAILVVAAVVVVDVSRHAVRRAAGCGSLAALTDDDLGIAFDHAQNVGFLHDQVLDRKSDV